MTKKDFEVIAKVFRDYAVYSDSFSDSPWRKTAHCEMVSRFTDVLMRENPRFNRDKFLKACGVED